MLISTVTKRLVLNNPRRQYSKFGGQFVFNDTGSEKFSKKLNKHQLQNETKKTMDSMRADAAQQKLMQRASEVSLDSDTESDPDMLAGYSTMSAVEMIADRKIRLSQAKGEFENLPFQGKPLPGTFDEASTIVDQTEDYVYKMLKRNNFLPEWVELNKKIHENIKKSRETLYETHRKLFLEKEVKEPVQPAKESGFISKLSDWLFPVGSETITPLKPVNKEQKWEQTKQVFVQKLDEINADIKKYNTMVPPNTQMYPLRLDVELEKLAQEQPIDINKAIN